MTILLKQGQSLGGAKLTPSKLHVAEISNLIYNTSVQLYKSRKGIMKHYGFTLAETLITLGIIGVIAALTLPSVMSSYKNKTYVAQLQKVYNQFSNAAMQMMLDEDVDNLTDTYLYSNYSYSIDKDTPEADKNNITRSALTDSSGRFLKKYFRITKDCSISPDDCFADTYKSLDKSASATASEAIYEDYEKKYCVSINTGASICMSEMNEDDHYENADMDHGYSKIVIDVNGKAGPNISGRDLFGFQLYSDGTVGSSHTPGGDRSESICTAEGKINDPTYGSGCFEKVIGDGWAMDY